MLKKRNSKPLHYQTVFKWFLRIFISLSLIFCFALIPLFFYLQNTFTELQIEKRTQMLNTGVSQISSLTKGMINISESLFSDSRFSKLHYKNVDYDTIPISTQNQLQESFENLMFPFSSVSHTALLLNEKAVITNNTVFFNHQLDYYPDCFKVDDLNFDEWTNLLAETGTGFTPACHIKTYSSEYDALTFVTPWTNDTYLYACVDTTDIKKMILENDNLKDCYFTIERLDGTLLYSDLPNESADYQTFTEFCQAGELNVSVHIPDSVFYQNMKPLYIFLAVYIIACIIILITLNILGTKHAIKPILNIIHVLERSRNIKPTANNIQKNYQDGFEYISSSIMTADQHLEEYQATVHTQHKILQARFLEKAISGQLVSKNEIKLFHSYFPNFPEKYYMLLIRLWTYTDEDSDGHYTEPLLLIQSFLETELENVYQQQLNDTELLLIIPETNYEVACEQLNFMINNINLEEPNYHACCISSDLNNQLESLALAYRKLRAMDGLSFSDYRTHICTIEDYISDSKVPITMADLMTLYTAITSGNVELSINRLASYSKELSIPENISFMYPIFDIMKAMLTYIKLEYPQLLAEQRIPNFQHGKNLYEQLIDVVQSFCTSICQYKNIDKDSFTQELFNYIDTHFTDCDLCLTSLTTHFKCSESTIRKAFKRSTDVTVSRYIEQKRMILANELLAQNEKSVTEIALACGFSLPHSFYKAYKRVYGHAPTLPNQTE